MVKKEGKGMPVFIRILIYSVILFSIYTSLSVFVLALFGDSVRGTLTGYDSRLDDQRAEANRSRTVSKHYVFTVDGKEYKGFAMYQSDEAWPSLSPDEVRAEWISYLGIFPYVNKPAHLVEFDELGLVGVFFHIIRLIGSVLLLLLVSGKLIRKKGQAAGRPADTIAPERDEMMFCPNCGTAIAPGAAFCSGCGAAVAATKASGCGNCGAELSPGAAFCRNCGTPSPGGVGQAASAAAQTPAPEQAVGIKEAAGLVGWSKLCDHPEILEAAQKKRGFATTFAWAMMVLFPVGFFVAGLFVKSMPMGEAIIIGVGLGIMMLLINLWQLRRSRKDPWEGVVTDKRERERQRHRDDTVDTYWEYTLEVRTDMGKKKRIVTPNSRAMYDYFAIGDRIKFHPAFDTYEKYDKTRDRAIYCNVCMMLNPIQNERCKRCNSLLFK